MCTKQMFVLQFVLKQIVTLVKIELMCDPAFSLSGYMYMHINFSFP